MRRMNAAVHKAVRCSCPKIYSCASRLAIALLLLLASAVLHVLHVGELRTQ